MRSSRLWSVTASVVLLGLSVMMGCQREDNAPVQRIRIATGGPTAVYYVYGAAYAKMIDKKMPGARPEVLITAASKQNLEMVRTGAAEVAFTQADVAAAQNGGITTLAQLYDDHLHLVVPASSPIRRMADIRGRRVSIGEIDSGTALTVERLFSVASLVPGRDLVVQRLSLEESISALYSGTIDAFFFSGGLPVSGIAQLAANSSIRLVNLGEYIAPMREAFQGFYSERVIPQSVYGLQPTVSIGVANYLVVSRKMSDSTAYSLTRTLLTSREALAAAHPTGARLNSRSAIGTQPLPLHPGAARYYRRAKT